MRDLCKTSLSPPDAAGLEIINPAVSGKYFSKVARELNPAGDAYGI